MDIRIRPTLNAWFLLLVAAMTISCSSDADTLSAEVIASSIEVGEDVDQTAPYQLSLYPGATVTMRLMGGLGMQISTEASLSELALFHSGDLEQNGYRILAVTEAQDEVKIESVKPDDRTTKLIIAIKPSDQGDGHFVLTFIQFVSD